MVADPIAPFEKARDSHLPTTQDSTLEVPAPPGEPACPAGEEPTDAAEDSGAGEDSAVLPAPTGGLGEAAARPGRDGSEQAATSTTSRGALKAFNTCVICKSM
jgi:hypothetical protein